MSALRIAHALGEPPVVSFEIGGAVAAVGPIVFAVVVHLRFGGHLGASLLARAKCAFTSST